MLSAMLLLAACNGDEKEPAKTETAKKDEVKALDEGAMQEREERVVFNEYSGRINELSRALFDYLSQLPMPNTGTVTPLTPIQEQFASLSEDGELYIKMNFQQYRKDFDPYPVLLTVAASDEKESLMVDDSYVKEGDLYISESNNDIVFQEKDMWVSYSSYAMDPRMDSMPLDHIKAYIERSHPDYQFASILQVSSNDYKYPKYMMNEELPITVSSAIFLDNEMDYTYQKNVKHNFTVANEDMRVVQSKRELNDYSLYDIEQFKQFASPMAMNGINGYYDETDSLGYYFSFGGLQFFIRPGQNVNQTTGAVSTKYHDNWEETIEKTVLGLIGEIQKPNSKGNGGEGKLALVKEGQDGYIYLKGISLKTKDEEVYEILGAPDREEQDEIPFMRHLIYEDEQLDIEVGEGFVKKVTLTSSNENIDKDVLENTESTIYQEGDYFYLVNEESTSVLSYNESGAILSFWDHNTGFLAENENAVKIR